MISELESFLPIIITLIETSIFHLYFVCFLGEKYKWKVAYFLAMLVFFVVNSSLSVFAPGTIWISLSAYLFCILYSLFLFSGTTLQCLFAASLVMAYAMITETVSIFFVSWIADYSFPASPDMNSMYFVAAFVAKLLLLLVVLFITKMKRAELLGISIKKLALLFSIVLICTFITYVNVAQYINQEMHITLMQLLAELSVFILSVLVFYIYERLVAASKKDIHAELLTKQFEQDIRYFKHMDNSLSEIKSLKHDFTGHLTSMKLMLRDKNYSELDNYIDKYIETVASVLSEIITGLPSVDATISFKKSIAQDSGIDFDIQTENISEIHVNPVHLNIIINNLLDNALSACIQVADISKRKIEILFKMEYEYLYIKVLNSSLPVSFNEGTLPKTTKDDDNQHGLGLETTKRLILAYDGILFCEYDNSEFMFSARLQNIENSEIIS